MLPITPALRMWDVLIKPQQERDEGGVWGNREHCNLTVLRSMYRDELELLWSEWAWKWKMDSFIVLFSE